MKVHGCSGLYAFDCCEGSRVAVSHQRLGPVFALQGVFGLKVKAGFVFNCCTSAVVVASPFLMTAELLDTEVGSHHSMGLLSEVAAAAAAAPVMRDGS